MCGKGFGESSGGQVCGRCAGSRCGFLLTKLDDCMQRDYVITFACMNHYDA